MSNSICRITIVRSGPQGTQAETLFEKSGKKRRKSSLLLAPAERLTRRLYKASKAYTDEACALHDKYSRKRRDGWLRAAPMIVYKANRKAMKTLFGV